MSFIKSLGGSLAGGIINIGASAFNSQLSDYAAVQQYNRQLDFWHKQNDYNSPLEQRNRFIRAGLNPASAVGQIASGQTAGGLSSVPRNEVMSNGMIDVNSFNNSLSVIQQLEQVGANTDLLKRQVELSFIEQMIKESESFGIDLENQEKQELLKWLSSEKEVSLEKAIAEIDNIKSQTSVNASVVSLNQIKEIYEQSNIAYTNALTDFTKNRDSREAQESLARIAVDRATEKAQLAIAEKTRNDDLRSANEELRRQAQHDMQMDIDGYLRDIHASEAEISEINRRIAELWSDHDHDYSWNDIKVMVLDFVHSNLRLGGSASYSKSTK